jgi:opacity protein-like surface antigen
MKKLVVLAFLICIASSAFAQSGNTELYLSGGFSLPMEPAAFSDYWSAGYNVGTGAGYVFNERVSFAGYLTYNNFAFGEDDFLRDFGFAGLGVNIDGGSASIISVSGNLKLAVAPTLARVSPYVIGGMGFSHFSIDDITVSDAVSSVTLPGNSESAFAILFGGGVDIPTSPTLAIFLEAQYAINFTDVESTQYFPFRVGMKFRM